MHRVPIKSVREIVTVAGVGPSPTLVALAEMDRAHIYCLRARKLLRTVQGWTGVCSHDGRWGLAAPQRGGLDLLDMKKGGEVVRTLLQRKGSGVFKVIARFTRTDQHILYYQSGTKAICLFRRDGTQLAEYLIQVYAVTVSLKGAGN